MQSERETPTPAYLDLLSAMTPGDDWQVDFAIMGSYSLDYKALGLMLMTLAGVWEQDSKQPSKTDFARAIDSMRGKVSVVIQPTRSRPFKPGNMKYLHLMDQFVSEYRYQGDNFKPHSWHPKFMLMRLSNTEENRMTRGIESQWRFWFGSKNFTLVDNLDIGMTLVSGKGKRCKVQNGVYELAQKTFKHLPSKLVDTFQKYSSELKRCKWNLPTGVKELELQLLEPDDHRQYPDLSPATKELFVLSPFLNAHTVNYLAQIGIDKTKRTLVSTDISLQKLSNGNHNGLSKYRCFQFPDVYSRSSVEVSSPNDSRNGELLHSPQMDSQIAPSERDDIISDTTSGLHAKIIMAKGAEDCRLILGSVNATRRGWYANVEVVGDCCVTRQTYDRLYNIVDDRYEIYEFDQACDLVEEDEIDSLEMMRSSIEDTLVQTPIVIGMFTNASFAEVHVPKDVLPQEDGTQVFFDWVNGSNPTLISDTIFRVDLLDASAMSDVIRLTLCKGQSTLTFTTKATFDSFDSESRDHAAFSKYLTASSFLELVYQDLTGVKRSSEGSRWDDDATLNTVQNTSDSKSATYWLSRMPTVDMIFKSWSKEPTVIDRVARHLAQAKALALGENSMWTKDEIEKITTFSDVFQNILVGLKDYA